MSNITFVESLKTTQSADGKKVTIDLRPRGLHTNIQHSMSPDIDDLSDNPKITKELSNDTNNNIDAVHDGLTVLQNSLTTLKKLHRSHPSLESILQTAAQTVIEMLEAEHCSICWFDETELNIKVLASHTKTGTKVNPEYAIHVGDNFVKKIRVNQSIDFTSAHNVGKQDHKVTRWEITAPVRVDKQIVGYIFVQRDKQRNRKFADNEKNIFHKLSEHINVAIEARRTRAMLTRPYVALVADRYTPISRDQTNFNEMSLSGLSIVDKEKTVKTIAHHFVHDLYQTGFETKHILSLATEIVHNLSETLRNENPNLDRWTP